MNEQWQDLLIRLGKQAQEDALKKQQEIRRQAVKQQESQQHTDFAKEVGQVKPLKNSHRYHEPFKEKPIKVRRLIDDQIETDNLVYVGEVSQESLSDEPPRQYAVGGQGSNDIKRLLSGKLALISTLDLHGYSQEEAQQVLNEFIHYVQQRGVCGRIVHGSGLNSAGFVAKLKTLVRRWLIQHPQVLAYTEPNIHNDGSILILLKRKKNNQTDPKYS